MTRPKETRETLRSQLESVHSDSYGWALTCAEGNRDLAEEALSLSYLKVLEGRARFGGRSSFKTWLFGVIRLGVMEQKRRRSWRRFFSIEDIDEKTDPRASGEAAMVEDEEVATLRRALTGLAERQRQLLHLVFYQELSVDEAARVLGIRVGTARTHYKRGKARLRGLLAERRS